MAVVYSYITKVTVANPNWSRLPFLICTTTITALIVDSTPIGVFAIEVRANPLN
jgi:hypothetical protein